MKITQTNNRELLHNKQTHNTHQTKQNKPTHNFKQNKPNKHNSNKTNEHNPNNTNKHNSNQKKQPTQQQQQHQQQQQSTNNKYYNKQKHKQILMVKTRCTAEEAFAFFAALRPIVERKVWASFNNSSWSTLPTASV